MDGCCRTQRGQYWTASRESKRLLEDRASRRGVWRPGGSGPGGVTGTASRLLPEPLPSLLGDNPGLKVELVVSDRFGDMVEDRLDLAMHVGEVTDASLVVRRSGTAAFVVVAAPSYIERRGRPSTPATLAGHTCIVHDVGPGSNVWTFVTPD